ncbi:TonB-dependent siderophore receptor [Arsenophonus sp. aPb]|uniref:TonB-dependent siderophore receptor n=1 Tax=Arsenophonus sp. aPb TaxID=3041619 RepID=UPI002469BB76|nr:TonB-dependent siderophore receptor [Arsenophonus sp. aPb]WGL97700.1 TonB-dependent siderophore receptor [Arsenophonus sp. aPb]
MKNIKYMRVPFCGSLLMLTMSTTAQTATAEINNTKNQQDTIVVHAKSQNDFQSGGDSLVPAYLDGHIAHGGRLGMLGEQNAMDVPFNVIGYTAKMVSDQQAKTVAEVVNNDAGVQSVQGFGNFAETYRIRGFKLDGDDMTLGGLPGILPRQMVDTAMIERVEIFKGANALVNGAASSGVGGIINLEPKRAEDIPITRLGLDYTSLSQVGGILDVGRRFGEDNQFGARFNLVHREGETAVKNDKRRTTLATLALDYHSNRVRSSLDFGYQKKTFHGGTMGVNISGVDFIPLVPKNRHNYSQKWGYSNIENQFGLVRAEYDLADNWIMYAGAGGQRSQEIGTYSSPKILNRKGDATVSRLDTKLFTDSFSAMAGVRGQLATGFITHRLNMGYSAQNKRNRMAWRRSTNDPITNIYHTHDVAMPDNTIFGGNYSDPLTTGRAFTQGWLLSDTLSAFDNKLQLLIAARHQKVEVRNYNNETGAEERDARYSKSHWMPTYGLVYKPWQQVALYANHTEALQPGSIAPKDASNYGQSTGIAYSQQNEIGMKMDFDRIGGTLALFEIKKPSALLDSVTKRYSLAGQQRNRGIELNIFGEPVLGLRLNTSATWLAPVLTKTQDRVNDGNDAIGVPRFNMVIGAEYDIQSIDGLTAIMRINHTGSQYVNIENSRKLASYTTLDLAMRYNMQVNHNQNEMVWRVGIDNLTNEKYWSGVEDYGTYIFQGTPRILKVSVSYDF